MNKDIIYLLTLGGGIGLLAYLYNKANKYKKIIDDLRESVKLLGENQMIFKQFHEDDMKIFEHMAKKLDEHDEYIKDLKGKPE